MNTNNPILNIENLKVYFYNDYGQELKAVDDVSFKFTKVKPLPWLVNQDVEKVLPL